MWTHHVVMMMLSQLINLKKIILICNAINNCGLLWSLNFHKIFVHSFKDIIPLH